jgi:transposase-like protein
VTLACHIRTQWAAIGSIAAKFGISHKTLRKWVRTAEVDDGLRPGLTTDEHERLKALERENRELRRANEILKSASALAIWRRRGDLVHHSDRGSQDLSIRYTERLVEGGIAPSVGSVGDSYDNAMAESVIGLYKTQVIRRRGPGRGSTRLSTARFEWVDWFNHRRLLKPPVNPGRFNNPLEAAVVRRAMSQRCPNPTPQPAFSRWTARRELHPLAPPPRSHAWGRGDLRFLRIRHDRLYPPGSAGAMLCGRSADRDTLQARTARETVQPHGALPLSARGRSAPMEWANRGAPSAAELPAPQRSLWISSGHGMVACTW